jgi:glyoxylase-like metal-dependent hydrolase (beta-lactamase superfamily II)
MMKRVLALAVLLLSHSALAADRGPALPDYLAEQVAPRTYVIHGPVGYPTAENQGFMNNPAFVLTPAGVVVIDPGSSVQTGEMVLRQIRKLTAAKVLAVLNTHVHGDHWLGNQAFRDADPAVAIYGHPNMIAGIEEGVGDSWVANMDQLTAGATRGTRVVGPNMAVQDGDSVSFGGITFRFLHFGIAHSNSDLMIEVPQEQVLFLADNVTNRRIIRMDDGRFSGNIATLDAATQIKARVLVPGHGKTGDWTLVQAYRDYLAGLKAAVKTHYDAGLSDFEMKPLVAAELARFADWPGFDDELGKHISLAMLEIEAESF